MHFLALPDNLVDDIKSQGKKRYIITVNDAVTWHCGLLGTGDGRWCVMVAKKGRAGPSHAWRLGARGLRCGRQQIRHAQSPDRKTRSTTIQHSSRALTPCFQAKKPTPAPRLRETDATIAKRILKLMNELGLMWTAALLLSATLSACGQHNSHLTERDMRLGNAQTAEAITCRRSRDKRVAVVGNHTSVVDGVHLVDTPLANRGVDVVHVFAPEHGFPRRGRQRS